MSMHRGFTVAGQLARRSLAVCAISSLIASTALTPLFAAFAQNQTPATQPASPGPPITAQTQAGDPPARVGRIARINGTVSFHTADEDQWSPATLNYPLTNGNALWTEPGARAELQLGSANRLVMDGKTELNLTTLDDSAFVANLPQGSAYVNLQDVAPGESYTIRTPRGLVQLTQPGRYAVTAGDDDTPTTVTTLAGAPAQLAERGLTQSVPAGQTATLNGPLDGDDPIKVAVAPGQPSAFAQSAMAEERQAQAAAPPPPAPAPAPSSAPAPAAMPMQVQGMTGAQDLATYGTWSTAPQYGSVWYPPVQTGWVPYRHGHWAWVPPWGWTWVADEPWGFAPFHYGRWVMVHDRWAWSPGFHHRHHHPRHGHWPRPVYAPALVAFFGSGSGVSVSVAIGRDVGWVPLGWHEPYYPPYRVSRNYIRNVNVTHVTNITKVTNVTVNNTTVNRYVNRNSATFVQADTMRHSRPVQQSVQRIDDRQMQSMRSERRPQVQPDRQRQMQGAPGPRIDQAALRRNEPGRDDQRMQRNTPPREISRRQDQPQMRQEQARQQDQRPDRQQTQQRDRQRQDVQRPDQQRPDRQPQQTQREQQPQRNQEGHDQQGRDLQRQVQQERQRSDTQRPDMQRQEQRQMQQQDRQRQQQEIQRQQSQQREQQMRQQADQQRQDQHRQIQREQQVQQQRHQDMQRQQVQQRDQQMRQQVEQQRQQAQQEQRRQQEVQSQAQTQRQQQDQRQQQRRRDADL